MTSQFETHLADQLTELIEGLSRLDEKFDAHIRAHNDYDARKTERKHDQRWILGWIVALGTGIIAAVRVWIYHL